MSVALSIIRGVGTEQDAQDLVQDAFTKCVGRTNPITYSYILKIVYRDALRFRMTKKRQGYSKSIHELVDSEMPALEVGSGDSQDGDFQTAMTFHPKIKQIWDSLPPLQQEVMRLLFDGHKQVDIANILGLPSGTVYSAIHKARKRLMRGFNGTSV